MEPRALDKGSVWKRRAVLAVAAMALVSEAWAVAVRDIRTDVKVREGYTRCVVELSGKTEFFHRDFLARKKYFLVDIYNVRPPVVERFITPVTGPVQQILVLNRKDPETKVLTLVFYLTAERRYRVFSVKDPFRVVVDVFHGPVAVRPSSKKPRPAVTPAPVVPVRPTPPGPVVTRRPPERYRADGKKIVIIDPGHGGSDSGARSYINIRGRRVLEKDVNLAVAREMKRLMDAAPNLEAYLTRQTDKYVSLGDRARFCDRLYGDLFISIHCNASDSRRGRGARGLELYYLNPRGASRGSLRYLEEIENRNGGNNLRGTPNLDHPIFQSLARDALRKWLGEGRIVCEYLKSACYQVPYYRRYGNREKVIQQAFFYVLFQAEMPAVLVELGFLTNTYDCRRLADARFQKQAAAALYNGVVAYFKARDERFRPNYVALPAGP